MIWEWIAIAVVSFVLSYSQAKKAQKEARKAADAFKGVLVNKESNIEPIPVVYGTRRIGGTRVFVDASGGDKNKYLYIALVLCEGEVEDIDDIKIDDFSLTGGRYGQLQFQDFGNVKVWDGGPDDQYADLVYIEAHHGRDGQLASNILKTNNKWTDNHRLQGVAYLAIRLRWNEDIFSGMPEITCVVKGRKVYNPRNGNTEWSDNPAACLLDYLRNPRYGKGLKDSVIDFDAFKEAARYCDETIVQTANVPAPGTPEYQYNFNLFGTNWEEYVASLQQPENAEKLREALFRCNYVLDTGNKIFENVQIFLLGMRGFLPFVSGQNGGKYSLRIDRPVDNPEITITPDDIIGGISIADAAKGEKFNRVKCKFANPEAEWQPDEAIWPDQNAPEAETFLQQDGESLVDEIDLETITSYYAARDLAKIFTLRSRNSLRARIKCTPRAMALVPGDVVAVKHPTPGWDSGELANGKLFQVEEMEIEYNGNVGLGLVEYDPSVYTYDPTGPLPPIPDTSLPDPFDVQAPVVLLLTPSQRRSATGELITDVTASWDAVETSYLSYYELAWIRGSYNSFQTLNGLTSVRTDKISYLVEALAVETATQTSGGGGGTIEDRFLALLGEVKGISNGTAVEKNIIGIDYTFGVRAVTSAGAKSPWRLASFNPSQSDTTPPGEPQLRAATGAYKSITITWNNPIDIDLDHVEIYAHSSNDVVAAGLLALVSAPTTVFTHTGLDNDEQWYYWAKAVDRVGNKSGYSNVITAKTTFIDTPDFTQEVNDLFDEAGLYAIKPYSSYDDLPQTGDFEGQLAWVVTESKLYIWSSETGWTVYIQDLSDVVGQITTTNIADNAINTPQLNANAVTADVIAGNTIIGDNIRANTITGGLLAASGIITSAAQINQAVIEEAAIKDAAITTAKIKNLNVDTLRIADAAVTVPKGAGGNVNVDTPTSSGTYVQVGESIEITWEGGRNYAPKGIVATGFVGLPGDGSPGTISLRLRFTNGSGGTTIFAQVGQSFVDNNGGAISITGFRDLPSAVSPLTISLEVGFDSNDDPVIPKTITRYGLTATAAKK